MERFREDLKRRLYFYVGLIGLIGFMLILLGTGQVQFAGDEDQFAQFLSDYFKGALIGFLLLLTILTTRTLTALRDDAKLENIYVEQNDEIKQYIKSKVGGDFFTYVSLGTIALMFIVALFDSRMSMGIMIVLIVETLARCFMKFYYRHRY